MTRSPALLQTLTSRVANLRNNTIVIDNSAKLNFSDVQDGVICLYAAWSAPAVTNCIQTLHTLYEKNYAGKIIVLDADCMTSDFQIHLFGQVFQGWGEIVLIRNGQITEKYLGKDCFLKFKANYWQ